MVLVISVLHRPRKLRVASSDAHQESGPDGPPSPCGACRQVLWEFADAGVPVVSEHADDGSRVRWTVGELLPAAFDLSR